MVGFPSSVLFMFLLASGCFDIVAADLPPHPFVLLNSSELEALRQQLSGKSWKDEVYHAQRDFGVMPTGAGLRRNADLWLNRAIKISARGGHFHNFFCEDGNRLEIYTDMMKVPEGEQFPRAEYAEVFKK